MKIYSVKDYFFNYISVVSVFQPEEFKLTYKEILFLTECCIFNYEGNDLSNYKNLVKHFLNIKFFKKASDISIYKYKLSVKKWIKSDRDNFILPNSLNKHKGDVLKYNLELFYEENSVSS